MGKKEVKKMTQEEMMNVPMVYVIINEQHQLLPDQIRILNEKFGEGGWERFNVPANGWTAEEQSEVLRRLYTHDLVFVSPVPLLLRDAAARRHFEAYVMHNDKREKKELPDGRIITTVAKDGWEIL